MKPTIARIVLYVLSQQDCDTINLHRLRLGDALGSVPGSIGNSVKPGDIVPMIIARMWTDTCVNGQIILDGSDTLWKTSATLDDGKQQGSWHWPERVPVALEATTELVCERREVTDTEALAQVMHDAFHMHRFAAGKGEAFLWVMKANSPAFIDECQAWRHAATAASQAL